MKDDAIEFVEYVAAVHLVLRGKLEDKLKWSFKVYDNDGNGQLEKHEVRRILKVSKVLNQHNTVLYLRCEKVLEKIHTGNIHSVSTLLGIYLTY